MAKSTTGSRPMDDAQQEPAQEEDCPLFMTKMPTRTNAGLDALAAIIDEDDDDAAAGTASDNKGAACDPPVPPLQLLQRPTRKKRGIGAMQVALALTGLEAASGNEGGSMAGAVANKRSRR